MRPILLCLLLVAGCAKPQPAPQVDTKPLEDARAEAARWKREAETNRADYLEAKKQPPSPPKDIVADLQAQVAELRAKLDAATSIDGVKVPALDHLRLADGQIGEFARGLRWRFVRFLDEDKATIALISRPERPSVAVAVYSLSPQVLSKPAKGEDGVKDIYLLGRWRVVKSQTIGEVEVFSLAGWPYGAK